MSKYEPVSAQPVKSFFVDMLTRDISLSDAILDLLDNCVDGISRSHDGRLDKERPYEGYRADIIFNKKKFSISDNCGGIPWNMHEYAWRMGNPEKIRSKAYASVGTYGIGMKRAIFKIGEQCDIHTQNAKDRYNVVISPKWMSDQGLWDIPVSAASDRMNEDGTTVEVSELHDNIAAIFSEGRNAFETELRSKIASHYAFIIHKGLTVTLNDTPVAPRPTELRFEEGGGRQAIRPFIYRTQKDGVKVFLAVGLTHPIPSQDDVSAEQESPQYSSMDAGWTVVCNDRAVLYCDRSELTGWGEAGIPKYHTQFIAISGLVEFQSTDPRKLPTTTTKRGIDASSALYLQVKNKMREGLQMFTAFTNKWKGRTLVKEAQDRIRKATPVTLTSLKTRANKMALTKVKSGAEGEQYKPTLPEPPRAPSDLQRISFSKPIEDIESVAEYLGKSRRSPNDIGEACFDSMLKEASR